VSTLKHRWTRLGNRIGVWMCRTLDGRPSSRRKDVHVLMLTSRGRRTGIPRSACVRYLDTPEGYVVREPWKDVVLAHAREVEKSERRAGRTIPVAVLTPVADRSTRA
jgi:hypothetical protein